MPPPSPPIRSSSLAPLLGGSQPQTPDLHSGASTPGLPPPPPAESAAAAEQSADQADGSAGRAQIANQKCDQIQQDLRDEQEAAEKLQGWWLPYLAVALAINVAVWGSIVFQVYKIEWYASNRKKYELLSWLVILLVGSVFSAFLIWASEPIYKWCLKCLLPVYDWIGRMSRISPAWKARINKWLKNAATAKYLVAIANALLCFVFVNVYFRTNALSKYHQTEWGLQVDYNETLYPPAFAFASGGDFADDALAAFAGGANYCTFPHWVKDNSNDCPSQAFNSTSNILDIRSEAYGSLNAYIFDPRQLKEGKNTYNDLTNRVLLQTKLKYNSKALNESFGPTLLQIPYVFGAVYDPRIDLVQALRCGLVAFTEIPAMGSNTFTITAESITDALNQVKPSDDDTLCQSFYKDTLTMDDPPYISYSFHLASMPTSDLSVCDTHISSDAYCISQVLLRYGSRVVSSMESRHGIEKIDILIFEGAIVGAIQFFMWFLSIFTL